jgi:hypothetical protein
LAGVLFYAKGKPEMANEITIKGKKAAKGERMTKGTR